jgi:hypothetical protein
MEIELMRARQWIVTAIVGTLGVAVMALVVTLTIAQWQIAQSAGVASIGGPFTPVDDTGATVTDKTLFGKPQRHLRCIVAIRAARLEIADHSSNSPVPG